MGSDLYTSGGYLERNRSWHGEDSPSKARELLRLLKANGLSPRTVCEVGCGAGEVLRQLQANMPSDRELWGYEISPQAYELCLARANERLHFVLGDLPPEEGEPFDLLFVLDVVEHVEDYLGFLRALRSRGRHFVFRIPLDMTVHMVMRNRPIMRARESVGHLHYFSKDTALATIADAGYEIVDHRYAPASVELGRSARNRVARLPRKLAFGLHQDLAVRMLGGYSLMVLAR